MKAKEIREKSAAELETLEHKLREELAMFRIQARSGQLAETSKIRGARRNIARILTSRRSKVSEKNASK